MAMRTGSASTESPPRLNAAFCRDQCSPPRDTSSSYSPQFINQDLRKSPSREPVHPYVDDRKQDSHEKLELDGASVIAEVQQPLTALARGFLSSPPRGPRKQSRDFYRPQPQGPPRNPPNSFNVQRCAIIGEDVLDKSVPHIFISARYCAADYSHYKHIVSVLRRYKPVSLFMESEGWYITFRDDMAGHNDMATCMKQRSGKLLFGQYPLWMEAFHEGQTDQIRGAVPYLHNPKDTRLAEATAPTMTKLLAPASSGLLPPKDIPTMVSVIRVPSPAATSSSLSSTSVLKCHVCGVVPTLSVELVKCASCPRRYHRRCHPSPAIPKDRGRDWQCKRCIHKGVTLATAVPTSNGDGFLCAEPARSEFGEDVTYGDEEPLAKRRRLDAGAALSTDDETIPIDILTNAANHCHDGIILNELQIVSVAEEPEIAKSPPATTKTAVYVARSEQIGTPAPSSDIAIQSASDLVNQSFAPVDIEQPPALQSRPQLPTAVQIGESMAVKCAAVAERLEIVFEKRTAVLEIPESPLEPRIATELAERPPQCSAPSPADSVMQIETEQEKVAEGPASASAPTTAKRTKQYSVACKRCKKVTIVAQRTMKALCESCKADTSSVNESTCEVAAITLAEPVTFAIPPVEESVQSAPLVPPKLTCTNSSSETVVAEVLGKYRHVPTAIKFMAREPNASRERLYEVRRVLESFKPARRNMTALMTRLDPDAQKEQAVLTPTPNMADAISEVVHNKTTPSVQAPTEAPSGPNTPPTTLQRPPQPTPVVSWKPLVDSLPDKLSSSPASTLAKTRRISLVLKRSVQQVSDTDANGTHKPSIGPVLEDHAPTEVENSSLQNKAPRTRHVACNSCRDRHIACDHMIMTSVPAKTCDECREHHRHCEQVTIDISEQVDTNAGSSEAMSEKEPTRQLLRPQGQNKVLPQKRSSSDDHPARQEKRPRRNMTGGEGLGDGEQRPSGTYIRLIGMALCDTPDHRLSIRGMCEWITKNIPGYEQSDGRWTGGINTTAYNHHNRKGNLLRKSSITKDDTATYFELRKGALATHERWDPVLKAPVSPSRPRKKQKTFSEGAKRVAVEAHIASEECEKSNKSSASRKQRTLVKIPDHNGLRADVFSEGYGKDVDPGSSPKILEDEGIYDGPLSDDEPLIKRRASRSLRLPSSSPHATDILEPHPVVAEEQAPDEVSSGTLETTVPHQPAQPDESGGPEHNAPAVLETRSAPAIIPNKSTRDVSTAGTVDFASLLKLRAETISYHIRSLFKEWPQQRDTAPFDRKAKIEEIKLRRSEKRPFGRPAVHARPEGDTGNGLAPRIQVGSNPPASTIRSPQKNSSFNQFALENGDGLVKHFDTAEEFLDLPDNAIRVVYKKEIMYRDHVVTRDGTLSRATEYFRTGIKME